MTCLTNQTFRPGCPRTIEMLVAVSPYSWGYVAKVNAMMKDRKDEDKNHAVKMDIIICLAFTLRTFQKLL